MDFGLTSERRLIGDIHDFFGRALSAGGQVERDGEVVAGVGRRIVGPERLRST